MRKLLIFAALAEGGLGVVLLVYPPIAVRLLLGEEIAGVSVNLSRILGMSLIGLGLACWPTGNTVAALLGMVTWSALLALYCVIIWVGGTAGILLGPAIALHVVVVALLGRAWLKERKLQ